MKNRPTPAREWTARGGRLKTGARYEITMTASVMALLVTEDVVQWRMNRQDYHFTRGPSTAKR
jgi:hypothetical protein